MRLDPQYTITDSEDATTDIGVRRLRTGDRMLCRMMIAGVEDPHDAFGVVPDKPDGSPGIWPIEVRYVVWAPIKGRQFSQPFVVMDPRHPERGGLTEDDLMRVRTHELVPLSNLDVQVIRQFMLWQYKDPTGKGRPEDGSLEIYRFPKTVVQRVRRFMSMRQWGYPTQYDLDIDHPEQTDYQVDACRVYDAPDTRKIPKFEELYEAALRLFVMPVYSAEEVAEIIGGTVDDGGDLRPRRSDGGLQVKQPGSARYNEEDDAFRE